MSLMVIDKVRRFMGCGKWKLEDQSSSFVDVLLLMSHVRGGEVKRPKDEAFRNYGGEEWV